MRSARAPEHFQCSAPPSALSFFLIPPVSASSEGSFWKLPDMRSSRVRRGGGGGGEAAAFLAALLCVLLLLSGAADAQGIRRPSVYKTLRGDAPLVIAKGGFSGVFPDSSQAAFAFALSASAPDTSLWCDVQLTKDGVGVCLRDINIGNCTNVPQDAAKNKKYVIDGVPKTGYFTIDFTLSELQTNLALIQGIFSRSERFDTLYQVLSVTDLQSIVKPPSVWLNVQRNIFYTQHGLNMRRYIVSILKSVSVKYISSPELGFLKSISKRVGGRTKLVFRIPDNFMSDPSTNQTYSSLSKNLTFIKTIASGIMVPNTYIWPVTNDNYLLPPTSFVRDAHSAGLEIYASDFANDRVIPYNYSYDPLQEYLSFISDGGFSVDGVLTDYPITASEAIGCFADLNESSKADHGKPLIISHNGASGDYPDCTDLAYQNAIKGGADVIDCALQVTKDGVLICMSSVNLLDTTNVQMTPFSTRTSVIPEIKTTPGIFTFNLTWNDISDSSLKPKISSPLSSYYLVRNPRYTNDGKFVKFSDFLDIGKDKDLSGIMIIVENAAFMAKSLGVDVLESLTTALNDAGYDNQTTKEVMIQSKDSAVLVKLKQQKAKYKLVYTLPPGIGDASPSSLADVKEFAEAVVVDRTSFFATSVQFIINQTSIVKDLQSAGLTVYAQVFRNEFVSQPWDFFSDETVEINSYAQSLKVDGLITDFPKTVRRYKSRNSCTGKDKPAYMETVDVGGLAQLLERNAVPQAQPPTVAPMPGLNATVVLQPPLPPVAPKNVPPGAAPPPGSSPSDAHTTAVSTCILLAAACAALLL